MIGRPSYEDNIDLRPMIYIDLDRIYLGVNPHCCGPGMVHPTYVGGKPLSGFPTVGYMWTGFF